MKIKSVEALLGAHPDPARAAAHQRFRPHPVVRRHAGAHRDRMRHHRLGRSQGAGRRHGAEPGADLHDQRGVRAAAERRGPARHHPAVGNAVQRHARPLRAARGPRLPGARAARHHGIGDQRRRLRAVGHSRQVARAAGMAAARRPARRADAGLCLGRLGRAGQDRRAAAGLCRGRRVRRGQDARRHHRRRPAPLGRAACTRRARRSAPRSG